MYMYFYVKKVNDAGRFTTSILVNLMLLDVSQSVIDVPKLCKRLKKIF